MSGALRGTASKLRPLLLAHLTKQLLDSNRFHSQVGDVVLRLILMLLTLGLVPLVAKPKIAVVNIDTIYAKYHRKLTIEKEVQDKVDALKNSSRVLAVEETDTKLQELAETVRDKKLPAEARELAAEEFNSLAIEHQALIREMKDFLREEKRKTGRNFENQSRTTVRLCLRRRREDLDASFAHHLSPRENRHHRSRARSPQCGRSGCSCSRSE